MGKRSSSRTETQGKQTGGAMAARRNRVGGYANDLTYSIFPEPLWIQQERLRISAQREARAALRRGDLTRPNTCDHCGFRRQTQAHHEDYRQPLVVEFLCARCHQLRHKRREWLARIEGKQPKHSRAESLVEFYRQQAANGFSFTANDTDEMAAAMQRSRS